MQEMKERVASWSLAKLEAEPWEGFALWHKGATGFRDVKFEYRTSFINEAYGYAPTPRGWERIASFPCPLQGWMEVVYMRPVP